MSVTPLTLDQAAALELIPHRSNVRARLQNCIDVLQDVSSVVKTAECPFDGEAEMYLGAVVREIVSDSGKYTAIDTALNAEYPAYAASAWKTELDASRSALNGLYTWIETRFNALFVSIDPAGKFIVDNLTAAQKTAFANEMISVLG